MDQFQLHIIDTVRRMTDAAILDLVKHNLGGVNAAGPEAIPKAGRGRKPAQSEKAATPKRTARKARGVAKAGKPQRTTAQMLAMARKNPGEKRSPEDLAKTMEMVHVAIRNSPGMGAEQLGTRLEVSTKALALPIRKLLAVKRIRSEGQKRATKYFAV